MNLHRLSLEVSRWSQWAFLRLILAGVTCAAWGHGTFQLHAAEPAKLIAHWPLQVDAHDVVGTMHGESTNVKFSSEGEEGGYFNGHDSLITIPDSSLLHLGERDFSLAVRVKCQSPMSNVLGDLINKFDPRQRRGWNFHIAGSAPGYDAMSDARHVHFGIDDGYLSEWEDHGKPWPSNSHIPCLIVFNGELYCSIADADSTQDKTHVFRFAGGKSWVDCGRVGDDPLQYSVTGMIVHAGKLYAMTSMWDWEQARGQTPGLPRASNSRVYVYEGEKIWRDLGPLGETHRGGHMASFKGELYVTSNKVGDRTVFKYDGHVFKHDGQQWVDCGRPMPLNGLGCLLAYDDKLYVTTAFNVYQYEGGESWKCIGEQPHGVEQIHSMTVLDGKLHIGTWPQGYVLRYVGNQDWEIAGRLGLPEGMRLCNEVNSLTVYNGKVYAGVIPKAEVYRYEQDNDWTLLGNLARRPDWEVNNYPTWLRVLCLTPFQGRLFACTGSCQGRALDAQVDESMGRIYSLQAGQVVSYEHDIGTDWTHLAAVRQGEHLHLYVNGKLVATSELRSGPAFNLTNDLPMRIGFGAQNYFTGFMSDVRLYDGALQAEEVMKLR